MTHGNAKADDYDFIQSFRKVGATKTGKAFGMTERSVYARRDRLERKYSIRIVPPHGPKRPTESHPQRATFNIKNGTVIVGSDAHYWPGKPSTAHRAFVKLIKELKPSAVVMNGDAFDGASISRHPPIGWEDAPTVQEELECVQGRLGEIEDAAGRAQRFWPLGNHDARFETRLATVAPEYAKVVGVHLSDHLPGWQPCWALWVNSDVVIKHRFRSGDHAPWNNTLRSGKSIVTGHLHSLKVVPYSDYNGTRFGVDTGCLADPYGPQFVDYSEDNARNHRSGFVVLTFDGGRLMWPEVVHVIGENEVEFRGKRIKV